MWQCDADGAAAAMLHVGTGVTTGQVGVTTTLEKSVGTAVSAIVGMAAG